MENTWRDRGTYIWRIKEDTPSWVDFKTTHSPVGVEIYTPYPKIVSVFFYLWNHHHLTNLVGNIDYSVGRGAYYNPPWCYMCEDFGAWEKSLNVCERHCICVWGLVWVCVRIERRCVRVRKTLIADECKSYLQRRWLLVDYFSDNKTIIHARTHTLTHTQNHIKKKIN